VGSTERSMVMITGVLRGLKSKVYVSAVNLAFA
jgi:hypothetical protein